MEAAIPIGRDGCQTGQMAAAGFAPVGLLHEAWHSKSDECSGETDNLRTLGPAEGARRAGDRRATLLYAIARGDICDAAIGVWNCRRIWRHDRRTAGHHWINWIKQILAGLARMKSNDISARTAERRKIDRHGVATLHGAFHSRLMLRPVRGKGGGPDHRPPRWDEATAVARDAAPMCLHGSAKTTIKADLAVQAAATLHYFWTSNPTFRKPKVAPWLRSSCPRDAQMEGSRRPRRAGPQAGPG
jgi:hypothetical protein